MTKGTPALSSAQHLAAILWQHCAAKRCCCVRTVLPTGTDIWRIASTLRVSAERFLRPTPAPSAHGFALVHGQPLIYPALARHAVSAQTTPCVFLLQFGGQASRCGINDLRPLRCQAFPAVGVAGQIEVDTAAGCTCRTWSLAEIDRAAVAALLQQEAEEREQYHEAMRTWNVAVALTKRRYTFSDVCQYVIDLYETGR
jgi:Fe-S-cluster containining protein